MKKKRNQAGMEDMETFKRLMRSANSFSELAGGMKLRGYQTPVARAVIESAMLKLGRSIVVMFPRQSGKNELQAQIEAFLLCHLLQSAIEIVKISPTWKPQSLNAMRRLERVLKRNRVSQAIWRKEAGYIYRVGAGRITFLSGGPEAHIVGATAATLLEVDEAQDVLIDKYDRDIAPMAASTNATRVFWGTAWTSDTLLARELRAALKEEKQDGVQRVFRLSAVEVGDELPAYARFVADQAARLGRQHPMIKSQYFSEEIDAQGGMFPPARQALMQGTHPRLHAPRAERTYALLLDVAGEDEGATSGLIDALANPQRDLTALTVVEVDGSTLDDALLRAPTYLVVQRKCWRGVKHTRLYGELRALGEVWQPRWWVVDATGVGAGLASFLDAAFPGKVTPFLFNAATKSKLGWDFLAMVETGRFKDWQEPEGGGEDDLKAVFNRQLDACEMRAAPGVEKRLAWGVPDGRRDPLNGELLHDDLLISAALCAALEGCTLPGGGTALVVPGDDPLEEMDYGF